MVLKFCCFGKLHTKLHLRLLKNLWLFIVKQQKTPYFNNKRFLYWNSGATDGTRTHDNRDHNPGLYQLSYIRHTVWFYRLAKCAPDRIRTCDHPLRRRVLYPTELQAHKKSLLGSWFIFSTWVSLKNEWSEWKDSNLRPPGPKPGALPSCATLRLPN